MTKIIEFVSGAAVAAVLIWLFGSCFEIAFNGFAGDLNAIKILLEVTQ
jgi:hypothetical protein